MSGWARERHHGTGRKHPSQRVKGHEETHRRRPFGIDQWDCSPMDYGHPMTGGFLVVNVQTMLYFCSPIGRV